MGTSTIQHDIYDHCTEPRTTASVLVRMTDSCEWISYRSSTPATVLDSLTSIKDLNANFVCLRRRDLHLFDFQRFSSCPANGSLAGDGLSGCI